VALIFSGRAVKLFSQMRADLPPDVDGWGLSLKGLMGMVVIGERPPPRLARRAPLRRRHCHCRRRPIPPPPTAAPSLPTPHPTQPQAAC
jgi:hypothetical protein